MGLCVCLMRANSTLVGRDRKNKRIRGTLRRLGRHVQRTSAVGTAQHTHPPPLRCWLLSSTVLGLAVSTSHCLVGAVIGVGIVGRLVGEDSELNVSMLKKIVVGWAATIPLAMLVSVLAFKGIMFLYQGVGCA